MAATTLTGLSLSSSKLLSKPETPKQQPLHSAWIPHKASGFTRFRVAASGPATPPSISKKVSESIKHAEEACSDDPASGECVAAWDEVEELSAAASHARDKLKGSDPLEDYCKDNPETKECRTYED